MSTIIKASLSLLVLIVVGCGSNKPVTDWVTDSSVAYPSNSWITAVGSGNTPQDATDQALSNLSRIFKADISSERISSMVFNEYLNRNSRSFDEISSYEQNTEIRSALKLLNARILAQKSTKDGPYYALAGLNRLESEQVYGAEMSKIAKSINGEIEAYGKQENPFDKLRLWKRMNTEIGLLEGFESQQRIISSGNSSLYDYQQLVKSVDDIGRVLRPQMTLHVQTDAPDLVKDAIINNYEKVGFTYNPNTENPMLILDVSFNQSKALVERLDAIFFNWDITIKHLDPSDQNRFKTFTVRDRSGSTTEINAKARLDMDIKRRLTEKLPDFIETQLLESAEY